MFLAGCLVASLAQAGLPAPSQVPQLDERGRAGYAEYLQAAGHKAFVIAPGGTWAWRGEMATAAMAEQAALQDCKGYTDQNCVVYAVNDRLVFDARAWAQAWGPYLDGARARQAPEGVRRGQRFPDLAFADPRGRRAKISDYRGQVVFLHFWGSWCPPCQREMPELAALHGRLAKSPDIRFVFLPMREPIAEARDWLAEKRLRVPLSDPGGINDDHGLLQLANGQTLKDREVARVFPTTYVLDRHGVVVFAHTGPVAHWEQYVDFLKDAAARSGK